MIKTYLFESYGSVQMSTDLIAKTSASIGLYKSGRGDFNIVAITSSYESKLFIHFHFHFVLHSLYMEKLRP